LSNNIGLYLGVIKVHDDEKEERNILDYAYDNNWARCPDCGHIIQKSVSRRGEPFYIHTLLTF
jgi:PHP family Zn ribbon phosphoesterase